MTVGQPVRAAAAYIVGARKGAGTPHHLQQFEAEVHALGRRA
jgi:hypothetical protein